MGFISKEKSEVMNKFIFLLDGIENKHMIAAQCADIAAQHAANTAPDIAAVVREIEDKAVECMNVVNNVRAKPESRLTNAAKANAYQDAVNIILKHVTKTQ
jgi:hypothetical protein